jgi:hypothetical protein
VWAMLKEHHGVTNGYDVDSYQATYGGCYDVMFIASTFVGVGDLAVLAKTSGVAADIGEVAKTIMTVARAYPKTAGVTPLKEVIKTASMLGARGNIQLRVLVLEVLAKLPEQIAVKLPGDGSIVLMSKQGKEIARITAEGVEILAPVDNLIIPTEKIVFQSKAAYTAVKNQSRGAFTLVDDGQGGLLATLHTDLSGFLSNPRVQQAIRGAKNQRILPGLTDEEFAAVRIYTSSEMLNGEVIEKTMNKLLREKTYDAYYTPMANILNNALRKLPPYVVRGDNRIYRGVKGGEAEAAKKFKVGTIETFDDFKSTSLEFEKAADFSGGSKIVYEITSATGADISIASSHPNEIEILLRPGVKVYITEIRPSPKDPSITLIRMDVYN